MVGEQADPLIDRNLGEDEQRANDQRAIIVFAHLMYLHKQAFEKGTGMEHEDETDGKSAKAAKKLLDFQHKSRKSIKAEKLAGTGFCDQGANDFQEMCREVVPRWIGELSEKTTELSDETTTDPDPWASLEKLRRVWTDPKFTVKAICAILDVLGPFAYPFLESLAVRVPRQLLKLRCLQWEQFWRPVRSFPGNLECGHGHDSPDLKHLEKIAPAAEARKPCSTQGRNKIEVEVYFTQVPRLVQYPSVSDGLCKQQLELAVALLDANDSIALFATPVGQALAGNCWDVAFPQFARHKIMEVLALLVLVVLIAPVSHKMQEREQWPDTYKIIANLCFASYSALSIVLEALMVCKHRIFLRAYVNVYNVCCIIIEIISVVYVYRACHDYWFKKELMPWEDTVLYQHPMLFGVIIFLKWLQLMISMMSFNGLAEPLLPAWSAIKSWESGVFLFYLFLMCLGSCLAYYALPLELGVFPGSYFEAFFRMIRLGFLGDFEMSELEGKGQHINNKTWAIEDSDAVDEITYSLKGFVMVLGLFFPVILLNVYVGLLSEEYKKAQDRRLHMIASFRTAGVFRLHLHRLFWRQFPICPSLLSLDCFRITVPRLLREADLTEADEIDKLGTWILWPESSGTSMSSTSSTGAHSSHDRLFLDVSNALLSDDHRQVA